MCGSGEIEEKPLLALAYHGKFEKREVKPENVFVLIRVESFPSFTMPKVNCKQRQGRAAGVRQWCLWRL